MGWGGLKNGQLIAFAETEFDVFITVDRNLSFQQNLSQFNIAVIVLQAKSNRLGDLKPLIPKILPILDPTFRISNCNLEKRSHRVRSHRARS
jgi:hypothetical protein